jgi:NagD protein
LAFRNCNKAVKTSEEHVYTSALATTEFVQTQKPNGTAFVIDEGGLLNALNDVNYAINRDAPDYFIVGEGRVLNFELVERVHRLIAGGVSLLSTNSDTWCPMDAGPRPGCGAIVALLEPATGRKAYHVGKPNPFMMRAARKRINLRTDEVIMIGDTMDTGIRGATDLGFRSILVLTGSTTTETLKDYPFAPTHVVRCITDVAATRRQLTLSTG